MTTNDTTAQVPETYTVELTAKQVFALRCAIETFVDRETAFKKLSDTADSVYALLPDTGVKWQDFV